ncbi:hypothetical protein A3F29_00400 [Candidatus Roizmanbacteria bacterium RIFCSPHIGHO2_12_FULL_33_9]|uniref:Glycosyltransferase RgtA/B/C/D-like domain-containing protein n=1 Tax=Candidatus Roizmanbacteria bacterium RIFCSPHIGHO2_12_FULL_33_9 TaxID=1802045 RepID=A0A1F7HGT1_9BACT|nr:MAG: hypothetical protein A3F29_00400 [Candidatus Roizmanbacteria bacterium RIFCSPHIGHO2_12_FULL_33_9]
MELIKKINKHQYILLLILLFFIFVFTRSYQFESRHQFTWDQVDNAWVAKDAIIDNKFPLVGMEAKKNSGFYIGPLYYYYILPFYLLTNLDPIASFYIATFTSLITFLVLFYFFKKMFSIYFAIVAVFIYTFSSSFIIFDRIQWPVNFIIPISLFIFFSLYKILMGELKFILWLGILLGLSLHINFTSVLFLIMSIFVVPFIKFNKKTFKYLLISFFLFMLFLILNLIYELTVKDVSFNLINYLNQNFHGFHIRRFFQISGDSLISFEKVLSFPSLKFLKFFLIPIFLIIYNFKKRSKEKLSLSFLVAVWFLVPWITFSTYRGEISDYYFSLTVPMALLICTYLTIEIFKIKNYLTKLIFIIFWSYFIVFNFNIFMKSRIEGLDYHKKIVKEDIRNGRVVDFVEGNPQSYIYYYYTEIKNNLSY